MNRLFLSLFFILLTYPLYAQTDIDSLHHPKRNFATRELVLPISLITVGSLGFVEPVKSWRTELNTNLDIYRGNQRIGWDGYLRFLPIGSVYGLSLLGAKSKHNYIDRTLACGVSTTSLLMLSYSIKHWVNSPRPDGTDTHSFPSGHTALAFMGAELVHIEYGDDSPWYAIAAYTTAITVGVLRVYNNRHWFTDVFAGAGIGILSARIGHWLLPYTRQVMHRITGCEAFIYPSASRENATLNMAMRF